MTTSATHLLVGSPAAQSGKNAERIARAVKGLAAAGITCDVLATLPAGATIPAVAQRLRGSSYACVIAMGGDGTFREVGSGLLGSGRAEEISMGILPTGTANDQGRSLEMAVSDQVSLEVVPRAIRLVVP
jgi:diacylglycerol kinase family enzyme